MFLNEGGKGEFVIRDGQVLLEIKSEHVPETFYEEIDYFMNQHDQAFKDLVER